MSSNILGIIYNTYNYAYILSGVLLRWLNGLRHQVAQQTWIWVCRAYLSVRTGGRPMGKKIKRLNLKYAIQTIIININEKEKKVPSGKLTVHKLENHHL